MEESIQLQLQADPYALAAFLGYLILVIGIGIYATRFSSTGVSEFFIGESNLNKKARKNIRAFGLTFISISKSNRIL